MKRLISPPVQSLLWLGSFVCLGAAAWSVWQLRVADINSASATNVRVEIPDARALAVPGIGSYRKLVEAPLFWEERIVPKKAPPPKPVIAQKAPEVVEVELTPPVGRLVGIVDLGEKFYALVRNETENQSLYKGDTWEGWTVDEIDSDKMVLVAGKQRTEVPLIGDFSAPKANQQMLAARKRQDQRRKHQQQRQKILRQNAAAQAGNSAVNNQQIPGLQPAGNEMPNQANMPEAQPQPAPVLSIKEALEARQRLMASRWGNNKKPQQ